MDLSIIIPVKDERENISPLVRKTVSALAVLEENRPDFRYEIIFIDDGSEDGTRDALTEVVQRVAHCRAVFFRRNFGKSAAYAEGFSRATGDVIITMDGDLQDEPEQIPSLLAKIEEGYDLVSTWKCPRRDPRERVIMSRVFNKVVSILASVKLHDFNSGFKAYRAWCVKSLPLSGNLYRFIAVLVARQGGKIAEIKVPHHERVYGKSKYTFHRYFQGVLDLFTIILLSRFIANPMYFFAFLGLPFLVVAVLLGAIFLAAVTLGLSQPRYLEILLIITLIVGGFGLNFLLTGALAEFFLSLGGPCRCVPMYTVESERGRDGERVK